MHADSGSNPKVLRQQDTNETGIPEAEDDDVISLTESWADSSVSSGALSAKRRKHSRKPRAGRRARARAHFEEMCRQQANAAFTARNEASGMVPMVFLETLAECMEEDTIDDQGQPLEPNFLKAEGIFEYGQQAEDVTPEANDCEVAAGSDLGCCGTAVFEARLFKRDGVRFGMAFNTLRDGLLITALDEEGLAGIWNRMCEAAQELRVGDKVVSCRGHTDPELMLQEFFNASGAFRLDVRRGPFQPEMPEYFMPPECSSALEPTSLPDSCTRPKKDNEEEELAQARQLESKAREEAQERDAKQVPLKTHAELQRMIAERLAKSLNR